MGDVCGERHPAIRGLLCERHRGHRDRHHRRIVLVDGRKVLTEWTVYAPDKDKDKDKEKTP
jgi:hypothetical protein